MDKVDQNPAEAASPVVTRFAPSPTGDLHIGGLRTALYSYLMAKAHGGKFILRIEDTDQSRYVEESERDIITSLKWAGLNWDEGPVRQSERLGEYKARAEKLLETDHAYRCFCSSERLSELRESQKQAKKDIGYDRKCRSLSQDEISSKLAAGESYTVRLKLPETGKIKVNDLVRGHVEYDFANLEDLVIVKTDGFPTYHLAHVVDDSAMGVTHVFRGTEWIPTSPMHSFMFDALGLARIQYVHLPLILSPDGGKLSKRHGATSVKQFIDMGYTPEGLLNFLVLLGWSLDDKTEFFSLSELESVFDAKRISKSAATFAIDKLNYFNQHYIKSLEPDDYLKRATPYLEKIYGGNFTGLKSRGEGLALLYQDRLQYLGELSTYLDFSTAEGSPTYGSESFVFKKVDSGTVVSALKICHEVLSGLDEWTLESVTTVVEGAIKANSLKKPAVFMPLRVALTGTAQTPSVTDITFLLGKDLVCERIESAIEFLSS